MRSSFLSVLPEHTEAVLWDMDGVLIDSLELDYQICSKLLQKQVPDARDIELSVIRANFAYSSGDFWPKIAGSVGVELTDVQMAAILEEFDQARLDATFGILPGIVDALKALKERGVPVACVSNNRYADIVAILDKIELTQYFAQVVGNDHGTLKKKPAPDTYLKAAEDMQVDIARCVVVEDSLVGAQAGKTAGAFVIGVGTGGTDFDDLEHSEWTDIAITDLTDPAIALEFGDVRKKVLNTPNEFVSHMIEHIAWRLGVSIDIKWQNSDWCSLGEYLGQTIAALPQLKSSAASIGMIDDGSAEVAIDFDKAAVCNWSSIGTTDLELFTGLRCEQVRTGKPLVDMLDGLAQGLGAQLDIRVCTFEDMHHTWEGIYRAVGITLGKMFKPEVPIVLPELTGVPDLLIPGITITDLSDTHSSGQRNTAETITEVTVRLTDSAYCKCIFDVADTIEVDRYEELLTPFCEAAGISLDLKFIATKLSSSHVVLEDTAIIVGRALSALLYRRMMTTGVNGAGGTIQAVEDFANDEVQVAVSVEGRKFIKYTGFDMEFPEIRRKLMLGHNVLGNVRSEDIDDFMDGFAMGLACSIMVHLRGVEDAEVTWQAILRKLGMALKECFEGNAARRGVIPGVKAVLD
ncbi:MAG: HAD-IA family hydrolase [Methyloligellaceae bacterium]